jgi:CHAD domain-containing protein
MDEPSDKEALHDFRVALRRLRSLMRAYQAYLRGSQAKKLRQRLKALAGSTNLARDVARQSDDDTRRARRERRPRLDLRSRRAPSDDTVTGDAST